MFLSCEDTYKRLTRFDSVEQLNGAIRKHRGSHELTTTELAVLDVLSQYSCKYPGVSFMTKNNIGKAVGKSRRTVIRVCNRLESLGIIKQYELRRKSDGQQTSNAIVVLPAEATHDTQATAENVTPVNSIPLSKKELLHNTSSTSPYVRFKQLIDNKKLRNKIYGVYLAHTSYLRGIYDADELLYIGIRAVMTTFKASGIRNKVGYFNGVLDRMLDRLYDDELRAMAPRLTS
jgi:DNA-binding Lrp family transcriptional regulator